MDDDGIAEADMDRFVLSQLLVGLIRPLLEDHGLPHTNQLPSHFFHLRFQVLSEALSAAANRLHGAIIRDKLAVLYGDFVFGGPNQNALGG
jgi:hypothetical protein